MKKFTELKDVENPQQLILDGIQLKSTKAKSTIGTGKTIGLLFFNSSLRTRMSTQIAAQNLGMNVIQLNLNSESWELEFQDGAIMNGSTVEHIKDAVAVMNVYCDIIGVRCFPSLTDKIKDCSEYILNAFLKHAKIPIISLESATRHPLQSLADCMTIEAMKKTETPKIVLTWAPHVKALPQVVANSFVEWMLGTKQDLTITHPEGYELDESFTKGAKIEYNQQKALENADFVYVKNWSSFKEYGKILPVIPSEWMLTNEKLIYTNCAKIMHCLPVRRNIELSDEVLDSSNSLTLTQAENRIYASQIVLQKIIENLSNDSNS
jgi:N-succinyl-L-ornithine transcarbamylase